MEVRSAPARSLFVGRVMGVPVFLTASWFVVATLIVVLFAPTVRAVVPELGGASYGVAIGFALLLLVSVFVHEVAHAVAARSTGTPATHIVLDLWGGHTAFDEASRTPWRSALVAVVGPASNAVIALLAAGCLAWIDLGEVTRLLVLATATSNAFVAVFNCLPGLPLDGGRVLEALVWRVTGDRLVGTATAAWAGRAVAVGLVAWMLAPLLDGAAPPGDGATRVWLLVVAWLLWRGASQTLASVRWHRRTPAASVEGLQRPAVAVPAGATVAAVVAGASTHAVDDVVLLDVYGRPGGVIDRTAMASVPPERAAEVAASAVAQFVAPTAVLPHDLAGEDLIRRLQSDLQPIYVVMRGSTVAGVLDLDDVAAFVSG